MDVDPNDQEEDGANIDLDSQRKGKCAVIKTSTRQVRAMCPVRCEEQTEVTLVLYLGDVNKAGMFNAFFAPVFNVDDGHWSFQSPEVGDSD